jgi:hypothetical protein
MFGAEGHSLLSGLAGRDAYGQERRDVPHALFHASHVVWAVRENFVICSELAYEPCGGKCTYTAAYPY